MTLSVGFLYVVPDVNYLTLLAKSIRVLLPLWWNSRIFLIHGHVLHLQTWMAVWS